GLFHAHSKSDERIFTIVGFLWNPRPLLELPKHRGEQRCSNNKRLGARTMADRNALSLVGYIFSGIAAAVMVVAYLVVRDHVEGRLVLDPATISITGRAMVASGNAVTATNAVAATAASSVAATTVR